MLDVEAKRGSCPGQNSHACSTIIAQTRRLLYYGFYGARSTPPRSPRAPPSSTTNGAGHLMVSTSVNPIMPIATIVLGMTDVALHSTCPRL